MRMCTIQNRETQDPDPDSRPGHHAAQPPVGRCAAAADSIMPLKYDRQAPPMDAACRGSLHAAEQLGRDERHGSLDVLRYGRILNARQLVGVRGAGLAFDGMYYVNSVTHNIKRGEYKQNFTLSAMA